MQADYFEFLVVASCSFILGAFTVLCGAVFYPAIQDFFNWLRGTSNIPRPIFKQHERRIKAWQDRRQQYRRITDIPKDAA